MKNRIEQVEREPRVLFWDIETTPLLGYTWGLWQQNVIRVDEEWWMLCFSYAWGEDGAVEVVAQPDYKRSYKRNRKDDRKVVEALWKLLDEADVVVGHNVRAFDIKKANARFMVHGLPAPSPYQVVDTLAVLRNKAKLSSNRLDSAGEQLGLGRKTGHSGFDTWLGCMSGADWAWDEMTKYAAQDTVLLQDLYKYLLYNGWITNHPNMANITGRLESCPNCGCEHLHKRGLAHTKTAVYERYQCTSCETYHRKRKTGTGPAYL